MNTSRWIATLALSMSVGLGCGDDDGGGESGSGGGGAAASGGAGAGGTGASGTSAAGSGGTAAAGTGGSGAGGTGGAAAVMCGTAMCMGGGFFTGCCVEASSNTCGIENASFGVECGVPGTADPACPDVAIDFMGMPLTLDGCCSTEGVCGGFSMGSPCNVFSGGDDDGGVSEPVPCG